MWSPTAGRRRSGASCGIRESGSWLRLGVVSEEFGAWKPDPAIFNHALELIGADAESTVFVGDNSEHDILGAIGVGMRTAWMSLGREWEIESARPDYVLNAVWEAEGLVSV